MAYALKCETLHVQKGHEEEGAWFGYVPIVVPYHEVKEANDNAYKKAAKVHLEKSLARFRESVKLALDNLPARLGLAWTLEQVGEKKEAIKGYRALIEDAWKTEKNLKVLPMAPETLVTEAVGYLLPLLDKKKDQEEIATLSGRVRLLRSRSRPITPIAVPLRAGLRAQDIEDRDAAVRFDADGSGLKPKWTWVANDAGWLVYDRTGKHRSRRACKCSAMSHSGCSGKLGMMRWHRSTTTVTAHTDWPRAEGAGDLARRRW